jgi:hypothetical protein
MSENKLSSLAENFFTKYGTRFRRKEKDAFLDYCTAEFKKLSYTDTEITVQKSIFGKNLVVGSPDADILVTAHYDTPANNGFLLFSTPLVGQALANFVLLPFFGVLFFIAGFLENYMSSENINIYNALLVLLFSNIFLIAFIIMSCRLFLVKNKHNYNDNTSGVLGVFSVASAVSENPELRGRCAFVLFDNEEWGLLGSLGFANWRNKKFPAKKNSQVINLDCIANGDILLVAAKKKHENLDKIADFMQNQEFEVVKKCSMMIYLSDHANFPGGVMLSFVKRSLIGGFLYLPRIHTKKDTVCDLEKIERLSASVYKYISG